MIHVVLYASAVCMRYAYDCVEHSQTLTSADGQFGCSVQPACFYLTVRCRCRVVGECIVDEMLSGGARPPTQRNQSPALTGVCTFLCIYLSTRVCMCVRIQMTDGALAISLWRSNGAVCACTIFVFFHTPNETARA